jgi:hypothetical protein
MKNVQVYDPAMCCSTGVCGPSVDPLLARFSADLAWLASQGFTVERFNLSSEPGAFVANELVKKALDGEGTECLPMILCDGVVVSQGLYPTRRTLANRVGARPEPAAPAASSCCAPAKPGASGTGCC